MSSSVFENKYFDKTGLHAYNIPVHSLFFIPQEKPAVKHKIRKFHFSPEESQMDTFVFERVGKYVPGAQGFT